MKVIQSKIFGLKCADYTVVSPGNELFDDPRHLFKGYFMDLGWQMDVKKARQLAMHKKLLGFLGAPFPTAYNLRKAGVPIYARMSEFEPINRLFDKFLVDPLASWGVSKYVSLFEEADPNHELIVVCPSVHGHMMDEAIVKAALEYPVVKGLITTMGSAVQKVIDGHSCA